MRFVVALFALLPDPWADDDDGPPPPKPIPVNELVLEDDIWWCGAPNVLLELGRSYMRARAEYGDEKSVS